ncbi:MAG TPA: phosphotransferase [Candidatus Dormibacteraeota bacterium]|nr:phosphotransferase [Candidatus Dormibacteraeota bacterium]
MAPTVLDALACVSRLAIETVRLGGDRLSRRNSELPARVADLTPAWLTSVLRRRWPGCRVRSHQLVTAHAGTTDRACIRLLYDRRPDGDEPPPDTLFIKLAPARASTRLFVNLLQLGRTEVEFYRRVAGDVAVDVPRVFHAASGGTAQRFALVLEDLGQRGARFTNAGESLSLDDARQVMRALAHLHAGFWDSPRLRTELSWLKSRDHNPDYRLERFLCAAALPRGIRRFGDLVPPALQAAVPRLLAARDALEEAWAEGPLTLIHGDAHAGNLYFLQRGVGLFDWQVVQRGQGMRDVSYFLANSIPTELRRRYEGELIELYLATLAARGVSPPGFPVAWQQHRRHACYAFIGAAVTAAAANLQSESIVRAGLARSAATVVDLDSIALLA